MKVSMRITGFATDLFSYNNIGIGNGLSLGEAGMGSYKNSYRLIGFFSRANYIFDRRYLLMASIRYEGNSRFGANHMWGRSEEHTSELQSRGHLVCRLLLEKKNQRSTTGE